MTNFDFVKGFVLNTQGDILEFAKADKKNNTILVIPVQMDKEAGTINSTIIFNGSVMDLYQALNANEKGRAILEGLTRLQIANDSTVADEWEGKNE